MTVTTNHHVWALLARHPYCEDVLAWYGVDPADPLVQLTVEQLADLLEIDPLRFTRDLQAAVDASPYLDPPDTWDAWPSANHDERFDEDEDDIAV